MKHKRFYYSVLFMLIAVACSETRLEAQDNKDMKGKAATLALADHPVPAPIFIDPYNQGSCDPEIIWNSKKQKWYIYYTARRSTQENTWLGTPLGAISSKNLVDWEFKGYLSFDGQGGKPETSSTFWAPAIIEHEDELHMFVTWKPDTQPTKGPWGGAGKIIHYKTDADNPIEGWKKVEEMHSEKLDAIDATVYRKENGFHVWFKGKEKGKQKNELYHLVSRDLKTWEDKGFTESDVFNKDATGSGFEEAPYIFQWKSKFWLITDPHKGLFVYSSDNGINWDFQGTILKEGGSRILDNKRARHPSVAVIGDRAFIFYHVEAWRNYEGPPIFKQPVDNRRSVLQMAELEYKNGKIICNRNKEITLDSK